MFQNNKLICVIFTTMLLIAVTLGGFLLCQLNSKNGAWESNAHTMRILNRSIWHGEAPKYMYEHLKTPVNNVIICHTATEGCETEDVCQFRVRLIQQFHMHSFGWDDIGYNFLVGGDGQVYMGRGWDRQGRHLKGYGASTLSIAFIGTFTQVPPTAQQLSAAQWLIEEGVHLQKITPNYRIYGARQFSPTLSPGEKLYKIVKTWKHWTSDTGSLSNNNSDSLKIVKREYWLAQPSERPHIKLELPVKRVIILPTQTTQCDTQSMCTFNVRYLQTLHMEQQQQNDINYNFLIGGDDNIYEGRGWNDQSNLFNTFKNESITLAFIGKYNSQPPTSKQMQAVKWFFKDGVSQGYLSKDFIISSAANLEPNNLDFVSKRLDDSIANAADWWRT